MTAIQVVGVGLLAFVAGMVCMAYMCAKRDSERERDRAIARRYAQP